MGLLEAIKQLSDCENNVLKAGENYESARIIFVEALSKANDACQNLLIEVEIIKNSMS